MNTVIAIVVTLLGVATALYASLRAYRSGVRAGRLSTYADIEEPASWFLGKHTVEQRIELAKSARRHLREHIDETTLRIIEQHFSTHLPAFQKVGDTYDPYDAMRRDGAREVTLYLRQQLQLAEKEHQD